VLREQAIAVGLVAIIGGAVSLTLEPATPPKAQIVLPCEVVRVIDGDTVVAEVKFRFPVRLLDCWAPEKHATEVPGEKDRGLKSAAAMKALAEGKSGIVTIPLPDDPTASLTEVFTLGRVLGSIAVDGDDIATRQRKAGHAFATKDELTRSLKGRP
jgi:endonuclease YncB( thermonuclease family)